MIDTLIGLILLVIICGIVYLLVNAIIDLIPMDDGYRRVAKLLVTLAIVLYVISKALPMIGVGNSFL